MTLALKDHISTHLITVEADDSINHALMLMKSRNIRHLPVVNKEGRTVGIVSDRDLYKGLSSSIDRIEQVMHSHLVKADVGTDIMEITRKMIDEKISAILVTRNARVIGIVTTEDLLHLLLRLLKDNNVAPTMLEEFIRSLENLAQSVKNPNYV